MTRSPQILLESQTLQFWETQRGIFRGCHGGSSQTRNVDIAPLVSAFELFGVLSLESPMCCGMLPVAWRRVVLARSLPNLIDSRELAKPPRCETWTTWIWWDECFGGNSCPLVAGDTELRCLLEVSERLEAQAPPMKEIVSSCVEQLTWSNMFFF